ncbi:MAG: ribonuclease HII [Sphingomonadales bacterium]
MTFSDNQHSLFPAPDGPTLRLELQSGGVVAGVDEVGRGPWAGPVAAAAVILDPARIPPGIDDSKRLNKRRRERLHDEIMAAARAGHSQVGVGQASVEEVDRLNVLAASLLAMTRAIEALPAPPDLVLIDGNQAPNNLPCPARTIVKGDRISLSIAAASIVAKVTRDKIMAELAAEYPDYGWERNAGYGTRHHRDALHLVGISPLHRKSFAPIRQLMTQESGLTD